MKWLKKKSTVTGIVVLAALLAAPALISSNYVISMAVYCFLYAALGVSWNIVGGYGGQTSWCHATFVSIGAYTAMILLRNFNISPILSIPISMVFSFFVALVIGGATLRWRGTFFTISTIALLEISRIVLMVSDKVTGGTSGLYTPYTGQSFYKLHFDNDVPFYYLSLLALLIVLFVVSKFVKSKTGYYLSAVNGDEDAAISLGIDSFRVKLKSFELSAMMTSFVGVLLGMFLAFIDPMTICSMDMTVKIASVAIIGGLGTQWGPVLGAFIIIPATELSSVLLGQSGSSVLLYGLLLIIIVLFKPKGVISIFTEDIPEWRRRRQKRAQAGAAERGQGT